MAVRNRALKVNIECLKDYEIINLEARQDGYFSLTIHCLESDKRYGYFALYADYNTYDSSINMAQKLHTLTFNSFLNNLGLYQHALIREVHTNCDDDIILIG